MIDPIRLNQITLNLLSNAVKYTPAGGTVIFSADSRQRPDGKLDCTLTVRDTGIGMSQKFQQRMFEPFSQEYDNPGRPKAGSGTGLGLSIVHRVVELLGGTIEVHSELGRGTEIIARYAVPKAEASPQNSPVAASGAEKLRGTVLLAEDNPINTQIALRILTEMGLTVEMAENGKSAVDCFAASAEGYYRAVLMDLQMPVMNGYEAAQAIRALPRGDAESVPIIAMTADAFSAAMRRSREAGMSDYITKPLEPELLFKTLQNNLRSKADR